MNQLLIKNGLVVHHNEIKKQDILIEDTLIKEIQSCIIVDETRTKIIDASDCFVFPGIIDTHVHFREPGLTHKGSIKTESKAAVAGGITSVIDMPNTIPYAGSYELILEKKNIAKSSSYVNIGFFVGAKNDNLDELLNFPKNEVAGIKVFMGSSTGNVTIEKKDYLEKLFAQTYLPVVIHSESEAIIQQNILHYKNLYENNIPFYYHSKIRSREACLETTHIAIELAQRYETSLHVLHVTTEDEINLFGNNENITAEVCIPHLWFTENDFHTYGGLLKCNPSVKLTKDKESLRKALITNKVYTVGTDHAPHTMEEKQKNYFECPSGTTSIQHSLLSMLELYHLKYIDLQTISLKMAYNPAKKFKIKKRGQIKSGYYADLVIVSLNEPTKVKKENILYKCKWTLFEGFTFNSKIIYTIVNGNIVYNNGTIEEKPKGMLLEYEQ